MNIINGYQVLPKEKRKTILLLSDFFDDTSGVANMSKQIIAGTCHRFNWVQLACKPSIQAPNSQLKEGQIVNYSQAFTKITGVEDAFVYAVMSIDYGNMQKIQNIIKVFQTKEQLKTKIDAIYHFTDPRFWIWLYQNQNSIRQRIPIMYYNVWDNLPYPQWNQPYYMSCDYIANMSKQTQNIVKNVCKGKKQQWQLDYIPLGVNFNDYYPLKPSDNSKLQVYNSIFGNHKYQMIFLYSNRNITRKHASDILCAYKTFIDSLQNDHDKKQCALIIKSDAIDMAGTNLYAVYNDLLGQDYVVKFINQKTSRKQMNILYNIADITVSLSSAQGFGLGTAQSIMAGTPIIAPVTGGLQDQMRFEDDNGNCIQFNDTFPTNVYGDYKKHGKWVFPIFTNAQSTAGSPVTPYIWQSYTDYNTLALMMQKIFKLYTRKQLKQFGLAGRQWFIGQQSNLNHVCMCKLMINGMQKCFQNWKPKNRYSIIKHQIKEPLKYKGLYNKIKKQWV